MFRADAFVSVPLEEILKNSLIGQYGAIRVVSSAIQMYQSGWLDTDRPLVMLFLGGSGTGKTELAKQIAMHLNRKDGLAINKNTIVDELETESDFIRLDMSDFQQPHTVANLIGNLLLTRLDYPNI